MRRREAGRRGAKDCVKAHYYDLSADCQIAIIRAAEVGKACRADVMQFCADVQPGNGAIADCMKCHASQVSDGCEEAMAKARAEEGKNSGVASALFPYLRRKFTEQKSTGVALQTEGGTF